VPEPQTVSPVAAYSAASPKQHAAAAAAVAAARRDHGVTARSVASSASSVASRGDSADRRRADAHRDSDRERDRERERELQQHVELARDFAATFDSFGSPHRYVGVDTSSFYHSAGGRPEILTAVAADIAGLQAALAHAHMVSGRGDDDRFPPPAPSTGSSVVDSRSHSHTHSSRPDGGRVTASAVSSVAVPGPPRAVVAAAGEGVGLRPPPAPTPTRPQPVVHGSEPWRQNPDDDDDGGVAFLGNGGGVGFGAPATAAVGSGATADVTPAAVTAPATAATSAAAQPSPLPETVPTVDTTMQQRSFHAELLRELRDAGYVEVATPSRRNFGVKWSTVDLPAYLYSSSSSSTALTPLPVTVPIPRATLTAAPFAEPRTPPLPPGGASLKSRLLQRPDGAMPTTVATAAGAPSHRAQPREGEGGGGGAWMALPSPMTPLPPPPFIPRGPPAAPPRPPPRSTRDDAAAHGDTAAVATVTVDRRLEGGSDVSATVDELSRLLLSRLPLVAEIAGGTSVDGDFVDGDGSTSPAGDSEAALQRRRMSRAIVADLSLLMEVCDTVMHDTSDVVSYGPLKEVRHRCPFALLWCRAVCVVLCVCVS
jgi:hypothetical protein